MVIPRCVRCVPHRRIILGLWLRRRIFLKWKWWEYDSHYHNLYVDHYLNGSGHAKPELTDHGERSVLRYDLSERITPPCRVRVQLGMADTPAGLLLDRL